MARSSRHPLRSFRVLALPLFACLIGMLAGGSAAADNARPKLLTDAGFDQRLNESIPLELNFRDEKGRAVELRQFFDQKPVVLVLAYYECPMLCTQVLNGVARSLQEISLDMGKDFEVVTVSFNPRDTYLLAAAKKRLYMGLYGRPAAGSGWHFLTGDQPSIQRLAEAVGFRYAYDPESGQYAHPSGVMVLTPEGRLSRYFFGIAFPPRDLRLGLVEAAAGQIGSPIDQILLFCYHYDPSTGKYGMVILNVVRGAGLATVLLIGGLVLGLSRRERSARGKPKHI